MDWVRINFPMRLWTGALLATTLCAQAQNSAQSSGQVFIFSQPISSLSNGPSLFSGPGANSGKELPALPLFNDHTMAEPPAPLPMPMNSSSVQEWQRMRDRQENWALMTPEEILGVATPEDILNPSGRGDANGQNLSAVERFLARQQASHMAAPTNGTANNNPSAFGSLWGTPDDSAKDPFEITRTPGAPRADQLFSQLFATNHSALPGGSDWVKAFGLPPPPPPPTPDQLSEMQQFKQWLEPGASSPADSADKASSGSKFLSVLQPLPGENSKDQTPGFNPVGATFAPLNSGIGRPTGLSPLPPVTGSTNRQSVAPGWTPQPPPWQSSGPQPFAAPQRKF